MSNINVNLISAGNITVSIDGAAPVAKTVKPTITSVGGGDLRFVCDGIDEVIQSTEALTVDGQKLADQFIIKKTFADAIYFKLLMDETFADGGQGTQLLQSATVELTDAQIKALPTTGVEVIAAQGANTAVVPVAIFCYLNSTAGAYTGVTDASWVLTNNSAYFTGLAKVENLLLSAAQNFISIPPVFLEDGAGAFTGIPINTNNINFSQLANEPLLIQDVQAGLSNYGGGNAANTLKVTIYYVVIDL